MDSKPLAQPLLELEVPDPVTAKFIASIYAEMLGTLDLGHPLWSPKAVQRPGCACDVQLADVGFIDDYGGFQRLFNAMAERGHLLNAKGVPPGFEPIRLASGSSETVERYLNPGILTSLGVKRHETKSIPYVCQCPFSRCVKSNYDF